jgi:biotin transport system substrate-specific component
MTLGATIEQKRYDFFKWRYELTVPRKLALALGIAAMTGLLAQLKFFLPWSPVPVTAQTFAALLAGVTLGTWWGGISMVMYAGLGAAGVPWFQNWSGGLAYITGPTGGYVIGFILAALFLGYFTDKFVRARSFRAMLGLMFFASFVLVYVPGLLQLSVWLSAVKGQPVSFGHLLAIGAVPFLAGDAVKSAAAALAARAMTPKKAYGKEADGE